MPAVLTQSLHVRLVKLAGLGLTRRSAAASSAISTAELVSWIERGAAQPELEPWGSFAAEYRRAERQIARLGMAATAGKVRELWIRQQAVAEWMARPEDERRRRMCSFDPLSAAEVAWLSRQLEALYPGEYGATTHRGIDPDVDPAAWFERSGLQLEQLRAMLRDPPDILREALRAEADAIYAAWCAQGWAPRALGSGA